MFWPESQFVSRSDATNENPDPDWWKFCRACLIKFTVWHGARVLCARVCDCRESRVCVRR